MLRKGAPVLNAGVRVSQTDKGRDVPVWTIAAGTRVGAGISRYEILGSPGSKPAFTGGPTGP